MKAIIFSSIESFEIRESELHMQCLASLPGYRATRWAYAVVHPKTGQCALPVGPQIEQFLHSGEDIIDLGADWFPVRTPGI